MFYIRGRILWRAKRAKAKTRVSWAENMTVIVHHAADDGPKRNTAVEERKYMRRIQDFHMGPRRQWNDIAYNYIIMPSGRVYEGRGFGVVGSHAPGFNTKGIGICFAGHGDTPPTQLSLSAYYSLLRLLKRRGAGIIRERAHGDVFPTSCPGNAIRKALGL